MENFRYFELIAYYHRSIYDCVRIGESFDTANARSFDDFWDHSPLPSTIQNIIVLIESMNVEYALTNAFRSQPIKMYRELIEKTERIQLTDYLNNNELKVFLESIEVLNAELEAFLK